MKRRILLIAAACSLIPLGFGLNAQSANAPVWIADAKASAINWTAVWVGKPVTGSFGIDSAATKVNFDPKNLAGSKVTIAIPIIGFKTQSAEAKQNFPLADWFDLKRHTHAAFVANSFQDLGGGNYIAKGGLAIKGVRHDINLPFKLKIEGKKATMNANLTLNRLALNIGKTSDAKAEWVDKDVKVNIQFVAKMK